MMPAYTRLESAMFREVYRMLRCRLDCQRVQVLKRVVAGLMGES